MLYKTAALLCLCSLSACGADAGETPATAPTRTSSLGALLSAERYELVADGVHEGPAIDVVDVLDDPATFTDRNPLRLEGQIVRVCQNKGCWLDVGTPERVVHVTFARGCERYVPLDARGRKVLLEGDLGAWEPSAEEREHLRADAAAAGEAAEPRVLLKFVATGAALPR